MSQINSINSHIEGSVRITVRDLGGVTTVSIGDISLFFKSEAQLHYLHHALSEYLKEMRK